VRTPNKLTTPCAGLLDDAQITFSTPLAHSQRRRTLDLSLMPKCPICQTALETIRQREGVFYPCHSCNGRAVTVSQIRHVLGERVAMKLLRLMKLGSRRSPRLCPFCDKPMVVVNNQEPPMELDACRLCNAVWFDAPTYESLPELSFEATSSIAMQATEIIALERLQELKQRMEEERKAERKKKPVHRVSKQGKDGDCERSTV
jgi:Zn-finger nucleic acid-binding protein